MMTTEEWNDKPAIRTAAEMREAAAKWHDEQSAKYTAAAKANANNHLRDYAEMEARGHEMCAFSIRALPIAPAVDREEAIRIAASRIEIGDRDGDAWPVIARAVIAALEAAGALK